MTKIQSQNFFRIYKKLDSKSARVEINQENGDWFLANVFVPPDYRNQGLATRFMEDILEWADRKGFILTTEIHSPDGIQEEKLIEILQRYGFEKENGQFTRKPFLERRMSC